MRNKYTKELLEPLVKTSINWAQVCRQLGVAPMTGAQTHIKKRAIFFGIDFSHFLGQASNQDRKFGPRRPLEDYLSNKHRIGSDQLKKRLFKEGIKDKRCEVCGLMEWMGNPAPLELDHINSNHSDNGIENLQILCPNCHANKKYAPVVELGDTPGLDPGAK